MYCQLWLHVQGVVKVIKRNEQLFKEIIKEKEAFNNSISSTDWDIIYIIFFLSYRFIIKKCINHIYFVKLKTPDIGVYLFRLHTQYILESQIKAFSKECLLL